MRILFAGLLFVLLFGLFAVPVAGEGATSSIEILYVGGVDALANPSGIGWNYDASSNTLRLNNAEIYGTDSTSDNRHAVYVKGDITIELIGTNTISGNYAYSDGIYADGNIVIIGDGSLTVSGWDCGISGNDIVIQDATIITGVGNENYGIVSGGSLSIMTGDITVNGGTHGITAANSLLVQDSEIVMNVDSYGLSIISGSSSMMDFVSMSLIDSYITVDSGYSGISTDFHDLVIDGCTIISNGDELGVSVGAYGAITITNGNITAHGRYAGISSYSSIEISNSYVTAEGELYGISASESITLGVGTLISYGANGALSTVPIFTENSNNIIICAGNTETDSAIIDADDLTTSYSYVKIDVNPEDACTISFDANGGTGTQSPIIGSSGKSYDLPACTFTAPEGQVFKAWEIDGTEYAAGASYTPTASVTAKAVWMVDDTPSPGGFTINAPVNGVVSWTASEGAAGYRISLRDRTISETEDTGKLLNNEPVGSTTSYDISSHLVGGHLYRVAVCAYNDAGKETWAELEFGDCQHTNLVDVDITYNGITKDFPQDAGDGTHYWYVNEVCEDCDAVQQENVKRTAEHNADTLGKNGVCECNYHRYETGLSYTMYAIEDANTYLAPEAEDRYRGGSIDKEEEVTVFSDRLGTDKSWSLIEYSVTGTSREKVRFVKSESLVNTLEKGSITITYPNENTPIFYEREGEDLAVCWVASGSISSCQVKVGLPYVDGGEEYFDEVYSDSFNIDIGSNIHIIPVEYLNREVSKSQNNPEIYEIIISGYDKSGMLIDEESVTLSIMHTFNPAIDRWGFGNAKNQLIDFTVVVDDDTQKFRWEDFTAVFGNDEITRKIYENTEYGGSCFGMVASVIQVYSNTIPIDGFNDETILRLKDCGPLSLKSVTHEMFDESTTKNLGAYIVQCQLYQNDVNVQDTLYDNGFNNYESIIQTIQDNRLVLIDMIRNTVSTTSNPNKEQGGVNHVVLGYAVENVSENGKEYIKIKVYDPNWGEAYFEFTKNSWSNAFEWEYHADYLGEKDTYSSDSHHLLYLSEEDVCDLFRNGIVDNKLQFKHSNELLYERNLIDKNLLNDRVILEIIDRNGNPLEPKEYIITRNNGDVLQTSVIFSRIPKEEIQLVSAHGGSAVISDVHSSVELTLDAGTTASVIVDDTKESSVEITSDDENTNHEFTVTYGYDSTADKGYQEATVKGTMSDSFKGEATENGLKLTGLDSAEILVENSKGESVSVGTIQNADEYEDIVIDIDTSVKVTGNKDGVSDVLVSVPLNKVQYESSGSSKDTGSGNYAEYPRSVTNGGYVDFGTSPVVKGVTLPEGVSGKVVLIAKSETPAPEGKEAYGVFEINVDSYPIGEKAVISFTIPLSDLQKKGFTEKDICLYHFDGEVWTKLPTTYTVEGDKVFYEAETTEFSPFAIIYEKNGATSATVSEIPVEPEKPGDEPVSDITDTLKPTETPGDRPQETESPAPVLGMVLGGLGAAVLMRRK